MKKEVIRVVAGLFSVDHVPTLKSMKNEVVMKLTGAKFDKRALTVKEFENPTMKFISMMIGYKIFFTHRENYIFVIAISTANEMVKKKVDYDLCELLRLQLLENLQKTKDSWYPIKYGTLIMHFFC